MRERVGGGRGRCIGRGRGGGCGGCCGDSEVTGSGRRSGGGGVSDATWSALMSCRERRGTIPDSRFPNPNRTLGARVESSRRMITTQQLQY